MLQQLPTLYKEEPDGLAGATEGGEVGDVVSVGGDEHHVRGVRVAAGLEEGEVAAGGIMRIYEGLSPPLLSSSDSWSGPRTAPPTRSISKIYLRSIVCEASCHSSHSGHSGHLGHPASCHPPVILSSCHPVMSSFHYNMFTDGVTHNIRIYRSASQTINY